MSDVLKIHRENPKYFEFRGKPLTLVTATEHYGAVINRPFRYERYLADVAEKHITFTRLFCLFRELQSCVNPYSTCKPESPDFIAPFRRTGPNRACDGQPIFDLDQWNPEFFERLHGFLSLASEYGIIVEVVLLSNTYEPRIWELNPLYAENNVNGLPKIPWTDYNTLRHSAIFERQVAHVRKIVQETNQYDNIFYEICNEPGGGLTDIAGAPTVEDVDQWQTALANVIRETENTLPNRHLIAGHEAFAYQPFVHPADKSFRELFFDVVNIHPLPAIAWQDKRYNMGEFMSKQLCLRPLRDFCLDTFAQPKPLNFDEDNVASQYKDFDGWTIHRKRAWTTLLNGAHYDYIDFSIINYCETGTPNSQRHIRTWMKHLSDFVHAFDFIHAVPLRNALKEQPPHTCESVLAVTGKEYAIYLADERELIEPGAGESIQGSIHLSLPAGPFRVAAFSPVTGLYSPWSTISGGPDTRILVPEFSHDIVIRIEGL